MSNLIFNRSSAVRAITFSAATAMTSAAAIAACGGAPNLVALSSIAGPPSISATEASTDQALELIRKRREEASGGSCPAGFTRSGGNCVPVTVAASVPAAAAPAAPQQQVSVTTTTTQGAAPPPPAAASAAPRPKRPAARPAGQQQVASAAPVSAPAAPASGYSGGSLKDGGYEPVMPGTIRAKGVWLEGYYDYEKHKNMNPGREANPTRRMVSGGALAGVDISEYATGGMVKGYQFGFFGGGHSSRSKFSNTIGDKVQDNGTLERTAVTDARQEVDGGFVGIYGSMVHGGFSADLAFKADMFSMMQQLTETLVNCGNERRDVNEQTSMNNYIVASNMNYRIAMSSNHYIEPTVGLRYTHTTFGNNAPALGVKDGDAFRVQGGLRIGTRFATPDGWVWNTSLTGLLYSDVSINGYVLNNNAGLLPPTPLVDEGKLRAMGILENRIDVGYGYTLYADFEMRGGQDVIGYGARAGVRYQW